MTSGINTREMILEILLQINEEGEHSHIAIRNALSKYQFLPKQERAFITRVCEGTLEYRILIDYIIDSFSKITVDKMKPPIREILRSAVYQLKFMDRVPDSAVCNEAVKLAQRKGFYNLKPFVNGVLRTIARQMDELEYPSRKVNLVRYLSVRYSMPEPLVLRWLNDYGEEVTEKMLADFLEEKSAEGIHRRMFQAWNQYHRKGWRRRLRMLRSHSVPFHHLLSAVLLPARMR